MTDQREHHQWGWLERSLLTAGITAHFAWVAWISLKVYEIGENKAAGDREMAVRVANAEIEHRNFATHDEVDLKLERALRAWDERVHAMFDELNAQYDGPVNPQGYRRSIREQRERKERDNRGGRP